MNLRAKIERLEAQLPEPGKLAKVFVYVAGDAAKMRQADELEAAGCRLRRFVVHTGVERGAA